MTEHQSSPLVSVVVPSVNGLPYPLECLDALAHQDADVRLEVIVADCTGADTVAVIRERSPDAKVLAYEGPRSVPWLRAAGIGAATGRFIAVTEDHCVPRRNWVRAILEAHRTTGWAVVGGKVENDSVDRTVDWAVFFCEYSAHLNPRRTGAGTPVPGMNVAYDMDTLAPIRHVFAEGHWETELHARLRAAGYELGLDPEIVVGHHKRFTVRGFLAERFHHSRSFGGHRVAGSTLPVRMAWAAACALLPFLIVYRTTRNVLRDRRYLTWYARASPLVLLFVLTWTVGEFVGYVAGPGDSDLKVR